MVKEIQDWKVGYTNSPDVPPREWYPAKVPGAVRQDYARAEGWEPFYMGTNPQDYRWMEDVYWLYTVPLSFKLEAHQRATLCFKGILYPHKRGNAVRRGRNV